MADDSDMPPPLENCSSTIRKLPAKVSCKPMQKDTLKDNDLLNPLIVSGTKAKKTQNKTVLDNIIKECKEAGTNVDETLLDHLSKEPKLLELFQQPEFEKAAFKFFSNPQLALEEYRNDEKISKGLLLLSGVLGDYFNTLADKSETMVDMKAKVTIDSDIPDNEKSIIKNIMNDDAVQSILREPIMMELLGCMQSGNVEKFNFVLRSQMHSPEFKRKFQKLVDIGLFQFCR